MGYFNIELKPTLTGANCVTAFGNGDLIADWELKTVPTKQAFKVLGVSYVERGTEGVAQGSTYQLLFASPDSDGTVPPSLGTVNATIDGTGFFKHLVGRYDVEAAADQIDTVTVYTQNSTDGNSKDCLVIEPSRTVNTSGSVDFDGHNVNGKICIGIASITGAPDFGTGVLTTGVVGTSTSAVDITVDGVDARKALAVGDVINAQDGAVVGTVTSIPDDTSVVVDAVAGALANNDELCNVNPVTFIIHCEY